MVILFQELLAVIVDLSSCLQWLGSLPTKSAPQESDMSRVTQGIMSGQSKYQSCYHSTLIHMANLKLSLLLLILSSGL